MVRFWLKWLIGTGLLAATQVSANETSERWFEVEVLVFKNKQGDINEELWQSNSEIIFADKTRDFISQLIFPAPPPETEPMLEAEMPLQSKGAANSEDTANENPLNENQGPDTPLPSEQPDPLLVKLAQRGIVPFSPLQDETLQLTNLYTSLSRSSLYEPLIHIAWRQPTYDKNQAEWVRVVGGTDYSEQFYFDGKSRKEEQLLNSLGLTGTQTSATTINPEGTDNLIGAEKEQVMMPVVPENSPALTENQPMGLSNEEWSLADIPGSQQTIKQETYRPVPELDGAIQIYLNRYLHINTDLVLRIPGEEELDISAISSNLSSSLLDLTQNEQLKSDYESNFSWSYQADDLFSQQKETTRVERLINYPLKQSRRIRSGEIHYFDHPLFGVIVQVRPLDIDLILNSNSTTDLSGGN